MTTRVRIINDTQTTGVAPEHLPGFIASHTIRAYTVGPSGSPTGESGTLKPGEEKAFYVYGSQSVRTDEVPYVAPASPIPPPDAA